MRENRTQNIAQNTNEFSPGDLVVMLPDYEAGRYLTYSGIAIGSDTVFINNSLIHGVYLKKMENLSESNLKMQKSLQEQYVKVINQTLSYDFDEMKAGDVFSYDYVVYLYLGKYFSADNGEGKELHTYLMLDVVLKKFGSNHQAAIRFYNRLLTGSISQNYLLRYLKKYKGLNLVEEPHKEFYYLGHYNLPISERVKEFLSSF